MRVAILTETFSPKMGYLQNNLTKYLAKLGVDVHLITMDLPPYYQLQDFQQCYGSFAVSDGLKPGLVKPHDGYTLHVLSHRKRLGYMRMEGLWTKLKSLRPDVVQTIACIGWIPLDAIIAKPLLRYVVFTGCHTTASVFPLAQRPTSSTDLELWRSRASRAMSGRVVSLLTERCYAATVDCADIAVRFFGVETRKVDVCPLGIDIERFQPSQMQDGLEERDRIRRRFGFSDTDIVCIYTGRFTNDKNPLLLAQAISQLRDSSQSYKGLFVGDGIQGDAIKAKEGCVVHPFVPVDQLAQYFRSADIGVWPRQESMSMLDAASCGIPIVVNDTLAATERIDGNGLKYKLDDVQDLVRVLMELQSPTVRKKLGQTGAQRMAQEFSWEAIARRRLADYETALNSGKRSA